VLGKHVPIVADRMRNLGTGPWRGSEVPCEEVWFRWMLLALRSPRTPLGPWGRSVTLQI